MRPPLPSLTLSRRVKISLGVVGTIIVLLIIAASLVGVYINWLWFGEVGFRGVYRGIITTKLILFVIFGVLMAAILGGNIVIAYMLRPPFRPLSAEQQNLERYRVILEQRKRLILAGIAGLAGLSAGLASMDDWRTWMMWRYGGSFGIKDPQFHRDVSFFAWDYPAYRLMLGFGFTAIIFSILLSAAVHYLFGAIRVQTPGPKITMSARRHLTILVFIFIVLKALAYWLDRYGVVFSNRGKVTGASYTDVNASLPAKTILFWMAILIAVAVLASMWLKSAQLPAIGFGVLLVLSILINGIYPAIVQQFSVKPNASDKEAPYIKRNITATRQGYDVIYNAPQTPNGTVNYQSYNVNGSPSTTALSPTSATVSDLRILDPNVVSQTFTQQQQIKNQYGFASKLDIDRYTIDGVTSDYVVGVRELDESNLQGNQTNWINKHTVYTHGYGFVAAQADADVTAGTAPYTEGDIPPQGPLGLSAPGAKPQVYYGELLNDYSIVGAKGAREYDGSDQTTSYTGKGGVSLGGFFTKLAFAVKYKQTNFLLNDAVSNKGAKIIINRDPRDRVLKAAPFLKVDGDPYPIVVNGRIVWMIDAYTTMSNFPYSEQQSLSDLTQDTLSRQNKTASQPNDKINYIRNSVKATVDAYDGTIHLYAWDDQDPVLKAWRKAFPGLVQDKSQMPQDVLAHVRYPEDLFEVQRGILEQYHVDDPVTFYNVRDKWTVPTDPYAANVNQPPFYVLANPPTAGGSSAQFQLTTPMKVNNRQNLAAYISVDSDPGPNYGKMTVLKLPTNSAVRGPEQISNIFSTTAVISKDISLLSTGGSNVIHGNLLTLPIGNAFLYIEPLYVQGTGTSGYPILQRVLAVYGDKVGYAADLAGALDNLDHGPTGVSLPGAGTTTTPTPTPTPTPPPTGSSPPTTTPPSSTPSNAQAVLTQLNAAFNTLQNAYKSGDFKAIGDAQAEVQRLTQQYLTLLSSSPTPKPSSTR